jgi:hypothetical protein
MEVTAQIAALHQVRGDFLCLVTAFGLASSIDNCATDGEF